MSEIFEEPENITGNAAGIAATTGQSVNVEVSCDGIRR
jgi:hypothetical protein